jgi:hypothetical protein
MPGRNGVASRARVPGTSIVIAQFFEMAADKPGHDAVRGVS